MATRWQKAVAVTKRAATSGYLVVHPATTILIQLRPTGAPSRRRVTDIDPATVVKTILRTKFHDLRVSIVREPCRIFPAYSEEKTNCAEAFSYGLTRVPNGDERLTFVIPAIHGIYALRQSSPSWRQIPPN